ncbi:MAG: HAD-IA family hydrolase [Oscillospiraceae bacterium]|nr:HAD-IA family hydrolase [Oscillospiraceae bacterium]
MSNTFSSADIKLCIFDLDGTLVNTIGDLAASVDFAMRSLSLPTHSIKEYTSFVGNGTLSLIKRSLPSNLQDNPELLSKAHSIFTKHYSEHFCDTSFVYDGIIEALHYLKSRGVKLAVLSNKPDVFTKAIINKLFGEDLFDVVLGAREGIPKKPNPTAELEVIKRFGFEKSECVHVGDSDVDVITAHNAGIKCLGCAWGFRPYECLKNASADYIITSPQEIENFFAKNS